MPAPQNNAFFGQAKAKFIARGIDLPTEWEPMGEQFPKAFDPLEIAVLPNPPDTLFKEVSLNQYHVQTANTMGKGVEKYINGICGAVCGAIDKWMKMASIAGVIINGPVGNLSPGNVLGPPLMPLILSTAPQKTPQERKYSHAIAKALANLWQPWHLGLNGVLMFPPFAAFPGPVAPPTPNVPLPLMALSSGGENGLSPASLKKAMEANLADSKALHASDLFDALAKAFNTVFQTFKTTILVKNVMGTGPVPTFAPPVVPAGPVAAGTVIPKPGVLV